MNSFLLSMFLTALPISPMEEIPLTLDNFYVSPLPSVKSDSEVSLSARSYTAVDNKSNSVLFSKNENDKLSMASLTKLMTALIVLEENSLNKFAIVPSEVLEVNGAKAWLYPKEAILVIDLLNALLVKSANDAAITLAVHNAGSVEKFVEKMNIRARELNMLNTRYQNPHGLDDDNHYSTAKDTLLLAKLLVKNSVFNQIVSKKEVTISSPSGRRTLKNTNNLLGGIVIGGKTGTTEKAGECLFLHIKDDRFDFLTVVLGSEKRYLDSDSFIKEILNNTSW